MVNAEYYHMLKRRVSEELWRAQIYKYRLKLSSDNFAFENQIREDPNED